MSSPLIREDEAKRSQGGLRVFQKIRGDFALGGIKVIFIPGYWQGSSKFIE